MAAFVVVVVLIFLLAGNFWIPKVVGTVFGNISGFKTVIGKSAGSLLHGHIDLKNCEIKNPKKQFKNENFITLNYIVADFNMGSLFGNEIVIETMVVDIADVTAVKSSDQTDNYVLFGENLKAGKKSISSLVNSEPNPTTTKQKNDKEKRSLLIKNLTISLGTIHTMDEATGTTKEYKISYSKKFTNVNDFSKLRKQLAVDLGKFGLSFLVDSIVSSVIALPTTAVDGVIKLKDVSLDAASGVGNAAGKIGNTIGSGVKKILGK